MHCQQHYTYGAGQLANSICARTSTATHWHLSQRIPYLSFVCRVIFTTQLAGVQDAGTELSIDQLLSLIRSEVELNSTRWPLLSTTSQGNNTTLWVACGCMYVSQWYNLSRWHPMNGNFCNPMAWSYRSLHVGLIFHTIWYWVAVSHGLLCVSDAACIMWNYMNPISMT